MPTFQLLAHCPICEPPSQSIDGSDVPPPLTLRQRRRIAACPWHARVVLLAGDVELGLRSDWYRAPDGMARNHTSLMRTHPYELGDTSLHSWLAEVPAILAWYNVRLWSEPDDPWDTAWGNDNEGEGSAA